MARRGRDRGCCRARAGDHAEGALDILWCFPVAAAASALAMPFFAVLISALLVGATSTVPIAILAAAVAWILALAARRDRQPA